MVRNIINLSSKAKKVQGYAPSLWVPNRYAEWALQKGSPEQNILSNMNKSPNATLLALHDRRGLNYDDSEITVATGIRPIDLLTFGRFLHQMSGGTTETEELPSVLMWNSHGQKFQDKRSKKKVIDGTFFDKLYKLKGLHYIDGHQFGLIPNYIGPFAVFLIINGKEKIVKLGPSSDPNPFL